MDASLLADWLPLGTVIGSLSAAWGGALVAINGTKARVTKLEETQLKLVEKVTRTETKVDLILETLKERR